MHSVDSGVPSQPNGYDVVIGARQRAERSRASVSDAHFGVGIESGLFDVFGVELDVQVCSIFDGVRHTRYFSGIHLSGQRARPNCSRTRSRPHNGRAFRDKANRTEDRCSRLSLEGTSRTDALH